MSDLNTSGLPFLFSEDYKPDPDGRLRRLGSEDWLFFRIMVAGSTTPIAIADTLEELLEAGRQWLEYIKSARDHRPPTPHERAYVESLRQDASALDRLHRPNRCPVMESGPTVDLEQVDTVELIAEPATLPVTRELVRRRHLADGMPDRDPPDGPDDSPDPEATDQP